MNGAVHNEYHQPREPRKQEIAELISDFALPLLDDLPDDPTDVDDFGGTESAVTAHNINEISVRIRMFRDADSTSSDPEIHIILGDPRDQDGTRKETAYVFTPTVRLFRTKYEAQVDEAIINHSGEYIPTAGAGALKRLENFAPEGMSRTEGRIMRRLAARPFNGEDEVRLRYLLSQCSPENRGSVPESE